MTSPTSTIRLCPDTRSRRLPKDRGTTMWTFRARLLVLFLLGSLLIALPVTAQDTPAQPLTATFTSQDGSYSFQYPGEWVIEERDGVAVLATSDSVLASAQPARGEMIATLIAAPTDALRGLEADAPLEAVLAIGTIP